MPQWRVEKENDCNQKVFAYLLRRHKTTNLLLFLLLDVATNCCNSWSISSHFVVWKGASLPSTDSTKEILKGPGCQMAVLMLGSPSPCTTFASCKPRMTEECQTFQQQIWIRRKASGVCIRGLCAPVSGDLKLVVEIYTAPKQTKSANTTKQSFPLLTAHWE